MRQSKHKRGLSKFFIVAGIGATIGISVVIHAASLSTITSPASLKKLIPTTTTTKTPTITIPPTTPSKEIKITPDKAITDKTTKESKTTAPSITVPTTVPSPSTSTKETTPSKETKTTIQETILNPITKKNPAATNPEKSKTLLPTTTLPGKIEIPLKEFKETVTPLQKIEPLSPETTPFITLPLKDSTGKSAVTPLKIPVSTPESKEFIITTPLKNSSFIPLLPAAPEKKPETNIIIKITEETPKNTDKIDVTEQPDSTSFLSDVGGSNPAYQAISDMIALMIKQGNYASPKSKKFRPKNKTRWPFAAQLALSLSGDACGIGKGGTRQAACLAKAIEIGFIDRGTNTSKPLTKGEFYELMLRALKLPSVAPAADIICMDVDMTHEFSSIIATAKYYGITKRYKFKGEGGYCLPDAPLTKAEAAIIAAKALEAKKNF